MPKRTLISLCISSLLLTSLAHADTPTWVVDNTKNAEGIVTPSSEKDPLTVTLSKVVVSGVLKEDLEIAESAASIAHFGAQEVDRMNATSLADLLVYEPGVTVDQSKSGGLQDIRIRGMGSDRVMIAVDGAPLPISYSFGSYLSTNKNYFDIDAMKSIDIIKGPMSTLYGGSALAGGLFMQTKDPSDYFKDGKRIGGDLKVGYRSASNEAQVSGTIAGQLTDKLSVFVRGTYTDGHERRNFNGKASSESLLGPKRTHPNQSDSDRTNIMTKVVFNPNEDNRFSLTYEDFKETVNTDPLALFNATTMATTYVQRILINANNSPFVMISTMKIFFLIEGSGKVTIKIVRLNSGEQKLVNLEQMRFLTELVMEALIIKAMVLVPSLPKASLKMILFSITSPMASIIEIVKFQRFVMGTQSL